MLQRNMGRLDRTVRFVVGVVLIPIGLFALGGWQGHLTGILVAALAAPPLATSLSGFCPLYVPFGISTIGKERNPPRQPAKALTA